jgi:hypothetical protein
LNEVKISAKLNNNAGGQINGFKAASWADMHTGKLGWLLSVISNPCLPSDAEIALVTSPKGLISHRYDRGGRNGMTE